MPPGFGYIQGVVVIKKYSNRRLYDTEASRYVTLEELAENIRGGQDVEVVDAKSGADLTQTTLAQIILESRKAATLLPVPLLTQLIRMGDDALAEFFGRYVSWALGAYVQAKQGMQQQIGALNPFSSSSSAMDAFARMFGGMPWTQTHGPADKQTAVGDEVAELRRELEELKQAIGKKRRRS